MTFARIWLGALLLLMALGQAVSFVDFTAAVETYRVAGNGAGTLAVAVILAEVAGGAALFAPAGSPWRRRGAAITLGVAVFWSAMAVQAFTRGLVVPNCGCFGRFASQELRWWVLLEDAYFVLGAWWVHRRLTQPTPTPQPVPTA